MKATLTFDLREDQHAFDCVVNATKMHDIILEMREHLHQLEHHLRETGGPHRTVGQIRKKFAEAISDADMSHLF